MWHPHQAARPPSEFLTMHGLTASQVSELQGAVQALENCLLRSVDDLQNKRWDRPNKKNAADCLVRELAVIFFFQLSLL
jgi:hypothetical protein